MTGSDGDVAVSDFRINSMVRAILARQWIDLRALKFGSFRGTVRLGGELYLQESRDSQGFSASSLEVLESEIRRLPGVNRVYFDLKNWRRRPNGAWECTARPQPQSADEDGRTHTFSLEAKERADTKDD